MFGRKEPRHWEQEWAELKQRAQQKMAVRPLNALEEGVKKCAYRDGIESLTAYEQRLLFMSPHFSYFDYEDHRQRVGAEAETAPVVPEPGNPAWQAYLKEPMVIITLWSKKD